MGSEVARGRKVSRLAITRGVLFSFAPHVTRRLLGRSLHVTLVNSAKGGHGHEQPVACHKQEGLTTLLPLTWTGPALALEFPRSCCWRSYLPDR